MKRLLSRHVAGASISYIVSIHYDILHQQEYGITMETVTFLQGLLCCLGENI